MLIILHSAQLWSWAFGAWYKCLPTTELFCRQNVPYIEVMIRTWYNGESTVFKYISPFVALMPRLRMIWLASVIPRISLYQAHRISSLTLPRRRMAESLRHRVAARAISDFRRIKYLLLQLVASLLHRLGLIFITFKQNEMYFIRRLILKPHLAWNKHIKCILTWYYRK